MCSDRLILPHKFEKLSNFRDIGGLKTTDGYTMKLGVLFRSDELSKLTDKDVEKLKSFNIQMILDLRTPKESNKKASSKSLDKGFRIVNIPLHQQETHDISQRQLLGFLFGKEDDYDFKKFSHLYYQHIAFDRTSQIKEIISLLCQEENLPALIHCTAGKDRTGYISALIQLLVGIPYEFVVDDYLLTNQFYETRMGKFIKIMRWLTLFQVSPERMKLILSAQREVLDGVHDNIIRKYGSIERYLCDACNIENGVLQKLKNLLLE